MTDQDDHMTCSIGHMTPCSYLWIGDVDNGCIDILEGSVLWKGVIFNWRVVKGSVEQRGSISRPPHSMVVSDDFL